MAQGANYSTFFHLSRNTDAVPGLLSGDSMLYSLEDPRYWFLVTGCHGVRKRADGRGFEQKCSCCDDWEL